MTRAIEALETCLKPGWEGMALIRLGRDGGRLVATPLTMFTRDGPVDLSLWRPVRAPTRRTTTMLDWLKRLRKAGGYQFARIGPGATDAAIAAAWRQLLDLAEIGPAQGSSFGAKVTAHAERLDSLGLPGLASLLREVLQGQGEAMLRAAYGLVLARQQRSAAPMLH